MKNIFKSIAYSVFLAGTGLLMASCDTDVEPVDINEPSILTQNSALYADYLDNLKKFKASSHKVTFGWFDNSEKTPYTQGQHIHSLPDSLDYVVLTNPDNLTSDEMREMKEVRDKKATKVLYEINYNDIRTAYNAEKKLFDDSNDNPLVSFRDFNGYLVDSVSTLLDICTRYAYDGIVFTYNGKSKMYMYDDEASEEVGYENDFIGIAKDWADRHADKDFVIMGKPQYVQDTTIFQMAKYIIIPCQKDVTEAGVAYHVNTALVEGVPANKLLPFVSMTSLDESDKSTGYWVANTPGENGKWENKRIAVIGTAQWVASEHKFYDIAGMAIDMIGNDYFHADFTYPNVRKAISIINPTVKK